MTPSFDIEKLNPRVVRVTSRQNDKALTFREVLDGWSRGADLADEFTRLIAEAPFPALYWEMPPLTIGRLAHDFECVLINSSALGNLPADPRPFREHFGGDEKIAVFNNLGADAVLVAPLPVPADAEYAHLARFCSTAPPAMTRQFWQSLGKTALDTIRDEPVWISTAGLGVGWLHARLDSRPKYYSHNPYRNWPIPAGDQDA